ncbi:filamentous hemagglutinin family protein [Bradyrhizobium sp. CIR48]|uniref:filamentous haemagglutinin family protein n=1 Tax=Bradyrhizobium sp. CIR48 TaxID=2663840 RepID=UPI001606E77F|nr:filamentous haemagglutinin family protein [Bradyrhizobium sp. CIR48]MBB4425814.1 filamentous hemagglutinin family protein [Bradyrhizobium sp. CIR48]
MFLSGASVAALLAGSAAADARNLGSGSASPVANVAVTTNTAGQAASIASAQAMSRINASLRAMRDVQAAARAGALIGPNNLGLNKNHPGNLLPNVPNGLAPGGLNPTSNPTAVIDGQPAWTGAAQPTQSTGSNGRIQVEVMQNQQKAILTWNKFNVGRETDLYFNQSAGGGGAANWIALNRVLDPSLVPSQILGTIRSEGQVYIINKNGIIFGGSSQVDVGTLVATSLALSNAQFLAGINTSIVLTNDIHLPTFGEYNPRLANSQKPATDPSQPARFTPDGVPGDVTIQAGAQISAKTGGKAMLFAPIVSNAGQISVPDGQIIMAAGEQVYLRTNPNDVRGVDVAVTAPMPWLFNYNHLMGAIAGWDLFTEKPWGESVRDILLPEMYARAASVGYKVVNTGVVQSDRGNITVMGREIFQGGVMLAATALNNREGSIRLDAYSNGMMASSGSLDAQLVYWKTGDLHLSPGSVTAVLPDATDTSEIEETAKATRYKPGRVELRGNLIDIGAQANILVPAGTISIVASTVPAPTEEPINGETPVRDGSRIYIGEDAYVSAAGVQDVLIPMSRRFVQAELRINELRDSPLLRNSWLRGQKITVDRSASGVFADGAMAGVNWGGAAGEWIGTPLGDVSAWIGNSKTNLAELSTIGGNITLKSAGSIITRQGSLLDVSGGSFRYQDGMVNSTKLLGADGKIYDIASATPDRIYVGFAGGFNRTHNNWGKSESWSTPWSTSHFERGFTEGRDAGAIQFYATEGVALEGGYWGGVIVGERQAVSGKTAKAGSLTFGGDGDEDRLWLLGKLVISKDPTQLPTNFTATSQLPSTWYSGAPGNQDSFRLRTTYLDSDALADAGLGKIELYVSNNVTIEKGTTLELTPGSTFSIKANSTVAYSQDFKIDGVIHAPGGNVNLLGAENVSFGAGAAIDVSGQWVNQVKGGAASALPPVVNGGSITLDQAHYQPGVVLDVSGGGWYRLRGGKPQVKFGDAGKITLNTTEVAELANADMRAYAAGSGGSLAMNLTTESLQIGGGTPTSPNTVRLSETLFSERGFRSLQISTGGDITIAEGASVTQLPYNVDLRGVDVSGFSTGTSISEMGPLAVLSPSQRLALKPTSLSLSGRSVTVGAGATVRTDTGGTIALSLLGSSTGTLSVAGRVEALAGTINLAASTGSIVVANTGAIVARGTAVGEIDVKGHRSGVVRNGGSVAFEAATVALEAGSLVDVAGVSGEFDIESNDHQFAPVTLASNGGSISVKAQQGLVQGAWRGQSGGSGARGGKVTLASALSTVILSETAASQSGLVVRSSSLQGAGFADLVLPSTTRLDGVDLAFSGSISITGSLINGNGASSRFFAPYISLFSLAPSNPVRAGTLTLAGSVIDIVQANIRGFERTVLEASDIRLTHSNVSQSAFLDVDGTLIVKAGQIYPTSQINATIRASDKLIVQQNGTPGLALSAGGTLTLEAPTIEQNGTLRAPFGQITLKASQRLTLGAGSVTSVTGDGLVLPYGALSNNENWTVTTGPLPTTIASLPEKRVTLEAPTVELAPGSVVNIKGGGDLMAWEHVPGPGGSHDMLALPGLFAVMPAFGGATTPSSASIRSGDRIWLDAGSGLPAGWYTLLPASYAMLPGAYAIQAVAGSTGRATTSAVMADGTAVVSGYRANALDGSRDQQSSAWRVMSGSVLRQYSEYNEAFANTFFASDAFKLTQYRLTGQQIVTPRLPVDGGSVVFKATQDLILKGELHSQAAAGARGGLVDIAANKIAILGADQSAGTLRADGYLVIDAAALSGFGAGSLLVGGFRSGDVGGLRVDVQAHDIVVRNGANSALTGPEIILAASDTIDVSAGSVIVARGEAPTGAGDLVMAPQASDRDWGALIRLSNGDAVRVRRKNVDTTVGGRVTIGAGATLDGGKSLLIDATGNALVTQASLTGAALSLASGRIGFGGGSGLVLDAAALAALNNTQHLTLRSYSTIDFHSAVDLSGLKAVTLDAAGLVGRGNSEIAVNGNRVVLENTASTFSEPVGAGHGSLKLTATELTLGEGAKALRGFDTIVLTGTTRITGEGKGSLDVAGAAVTLSAPVMTGRGGSQQSVTTTGILTVAAHGTASPARDQDSLGSRWTLTGRAVDFAGRIDALGGTVKLNATNGNVNLAAGSRIDVGGFEKKFFDVSEYADAGTISLGARGGSVLLASGATLDLGSARDSEGRPIGGGAGTLAIEQDSSQVTLEGTINARAAAGKRGGSFSLDIAALSDFGGLNQRLNGAGFTKSRSFRIRSGDVTLDGATTAEEFALAADQGTVTVAGSIDARATYGGSISIYGGQGLTVTNAALLRAGATDTVNGLGSGRVTLGISNGVLRVLGGVIDVAGGEGGKVTLRAPVIEQPGADKVNVSFAGTINGAREIVLEGYKRFDLATLASDPRFVGVTVNSGGQAELDLTKAAAGKLNVLADYGAGTLVEFVRDFDVSAGNADLGSLTSQSNFHARAGMELNFSGDIVLKSNWNLGAGVVNQASALVAGVMAIEPVLGKAYVVAGKESALLRDHTTMVYRTGGSILGEPGVLTMRAGGNIDLKGSVTDGFFQFANPLDSTYVAAKGTISTNLSMVFNVGRTSTTSNLSPYDSASTTNPSVYAGITFATVGTRKTETVTAPPTLVGVPYSAEANSPGASAPNALAYSVLFPSITEPDGSRVAVPSWSLGLVAGATPMGESADPTRLASGATGKITLSEQAGYTYVSGLNSVAATALVDSVASFGAGSAPGSTTMNPADWPASLESTSGTRLNSNSSAQISFGLPTDPAYGYVLDLWNNYAAAKGLNTNPAQPQADFRWTSTAASGGSRLNVITRYSTFKDFYLTKIVPNLATITSLYATTKPGPTTTTVNPITMVRTGTGDVSIAARGDLQLKGGASIYTAGRRDLATFNDFTTAPANATYGVGGGHLAVAVGGNIDVALPADRSQMQHYSEWLNRQGATDNAYVFGPWAHSAYGQMPAQQSSWWIDYANFLRGVGALGGGNVEVRADGDLNNLTVALPTNGRVRGGRSTTEAKFLELRNGGAMTVEAGGAVRAGYYYIGRGAGTITAGEFAVGRDVKALVGTQIVTYPIAPILSLGDATLDVRTAGDLRLQTVLDPLLVGKGMSHELTFMSSQSERTALNLTSTGGDVILVGQATYLSKDITTPALQVLANVNSLAANIYPSKTRVTALNGSVLNSTLYTMPSRNPELRLLAANDVLVGEIVMSRAALEMIPSPFEPVGGTVSSPVNLGGSSPDTLSGLHNVLVNPFSAPASNIAGHTLHLYNLRNPDHLPNEADYEPSRVYALNGSIVGTLITQSGSILTAGVMANEQTWFRAGTDIRNINYSLRNVHPTDVSLLEAGNDIIGGPVRGSIFVQGPGAMQVSAGRDVYAPELAIFSTGNQEYDSNNRPKDFTQILGLPQQSAAITVMAGLKGKQPSYDAFLAVYLDPANIGKMPDYLKTTLADGTVVPLYLTDAFEQRSSGPHRTRTGIVSFVEDVTGEKLSPLDAWTKFQTLPMLVRERFVRQVYMQELRAAGDDQNTPDTSGKPRNGGYNRGYAAIETLFPGSDWAGDVRTGNAKFRTMSGGSIEVLTPGGGLQVAALGKPAPVEFGLVTLGPGDINLFARDSVTVNRSRILTFAGGNEIIWSTQGDIDAGRGAKTARVPSAPEILTDIDAVTRVIEKADISGSGIGTIIGFTGVTEGDVNLIAPQGTVNAGDAGIRVSGDILIAARFVVNVDNIQVSGQSKGVPKAEVKTAPLAIDTKDKAANDAVKDVTKQGSSDRPSVIIVEVLGYGGGGGGQSPQPDAGDDERRRAPDKQSYDPNGMFRVLGNGEFTAEQLKNLTEDERAVLLQRLGRKASL